MNIIFLFFGPQFYGADKASGGLIQQSAIVSFSDGQQAGHLLFYFLFLCRVVYHHCIYLFRSLTCILIIALKKFPEITVLYI